MYSLRAVENYISNQFKALLGADPRGIEGKPLRTGMSDKLLQEYKSLTYSGQEACRAIYLQIANVNASGENPILVAFEYTADKFGDCEMLFLVKEVDGVVACFDEACCFVTGTAELYCYKDEAYSKGPNVSFGIALRNGENGNQNGLLLYYAKN